MHERASLLSRVLSPRELKSITGLSQATITRLRNRGDFPPPIRLSPRRVGWSESAIKTWLDARVGPRDGRAV